MDSTSVGIPLITETREYKLKRKGGKPSSFSSLVLLPLPLSSSFYGSIPQLHRSPTWTPAQGRRQSPLTPSYCSGLRVL